MNPLFVIQDWMLVSICCNGFCVKDELEDLIEIFK